MNPCGSVLCIMHQIIAQSCAPNDSMQCIHGSLIPVWFNAVYQAYMSQYVPMLCIRHQNIMWLTAKQTSIYGPMLYIRHHNMAQTCVFWINMAIDSVHT